MDGLYRVAVDIRIALCNAGEGVYLSFLPFSGSMVMVGSVKEVAPGVSSEEDDIDDAFGDLGEVVMRFTDVGGSTFSSGGSG